jgi:hypothetical protein
MPDMGTLPASTIGCGRQTKNVVGLRWWPFEWPVFLFDVLGSRAYSSVDPAKRFVDFWFTAERTFVPELSKDQEFGGNKIFVSEPTEYLLSFHVDRLSPQALEMLGRSEFNA